MNKITNLEDLLDALEEAVKRDQPVSLDDVLNSVGQRSFGPFLVIASIPLTVPGLGDIPGIPTATGLFIALVAGQMFFKRKHLWLPQWLVNCTVSDKTLCKAIGWIRKPARYVDHTIKPRLTWLTRGAGSSAIAIGCLAVAIATPATEIVLFSANIAGAAISAYGLALIAHDGVLAAAAHVFVAMLAGTMLYFML